jgi:hypothetical protein
MMSTQTNQGFVRIRDIEEEEYIYKVPCAARETISLRDSVRPEQDIPESAPAAKKLSVP